MNPRSDGKPEPNDPNQVLRMIDIEMAQKRAARERAPSPFRGFRMASFIFLFAVILGALLAFYYVFVSGGLEEMRSHSQSQPTVTPSPSAP